MAFNDLLLQVGGVGRFQKIQVTLVILPVILMASHNTLQNFTAAIPTHHCRPPADTNLSEDGDLEAWLPRDGQGRPESCLLFTSPQRGPPFPNGTETNGTGATEPCPHGWIYDNSTFPSTIVTEVRSPGASALVLPMNTQDWSPLGWTGWISLQSKGLARVFSNTTVQKHQFLGT